ncbi:MAG TPA: mechanosensitive ion channel family protein [Polyangiaceae bacterium]|nr:mechanosensitive ion channel family protein [Polyangiaceae bacterium]
MNEFLDPILDSLERTDPISGGGATLLALALLAAAWLLLPRKDRSRLALPLGLWILHVLLVGVQSVLPARHALDATLRIAAQTLVLFGLARTAYLLLVHSFWFRRLARPLPKILQDVVQAFIYLIAFLFVLRSAGVEPRSLLATSAFLTAIIGLSLQDTLGNLFAGLAIQAQQPFSVGDWVELDGNAGHVGRVLEINWRATRVMTVDQIEVTVPNATLSKSSLVNFSRPTPLVRREVLVHATYEEAPERVRHVLLAAIDHLPDVLREPAPQVIAHGFTERGIEYLVRYFIEHYQQGEVTDGNVRERLWYAMRRAGFSIPVPRRQVEMLSRSERDGGVRAATQVLLGQNVLFQTLPSELLESLAEGCRRHRFASEEVIVHQGDATSEMYLIERGRVRIEAVEEDGSRCVVADAGRGEFFGEMSLMTGEPRSADVIACEETEVLVLDRAALEPVFARHPELAEHVSGVLAERQHRLAEARLAERPRHSHHEELELLSRIRRFFTAKTAS